MNKDLLEMLRKLAKATQLRYEDSIEQWEINWRIARGSNNVMPVLAVRMGLFDYLAAAQLLKDKPAYDAAASAVLHHADELVNFFKPQPELLLVELSLAIIAKQRGARRAVAEAVRSASIDSDLGSFQRAQALILAALADLDHDTARKRAGELQQACASCHFDKATTVCAEQWASAASKLAVSDHKGCAEALVRMKALHFRRIERELRRLERGAPSPLMAFDMLDFPGDALRVLLSESGRLLKEDGGAQAWEMTSTSTVTM